MQHDQPYPDSIAQTVSVTVDLLDQVALRVGLKFGTQSVQIDPIAVAERTQCINYFSSFFFFSQLTEFNFSVSVCGYR